uniref:AhpC-TSA domain-containing protein n=2 Tax=Panagrellus redivivus TaxID=6233 RepID=A0A7E4W6V4_PANRE
MSDDLREIVVIPKEIPSDQSTAIVTDAPNSPEAINAAIADATKFFQAKTAECIQSVTDTSAVSFIANQILTRIVPALLATKLTILYEALDVRHAADFEEKMSTLNESDYPKTKELITEFHDAMQAWEEFLSKTDEEVEKVVGPANNLRSDGDVNLGHKSKMVQSGTLLNYVQSSTYSMLLVQYVANFACSDTSEMVLKTYEKLAEFQKLNCDILMLTKGSGAEGSGFLKIVGVPFRTLLDEKESLSRILTHRTSAVSVAGEKALHLCAEMSCSEDPLELAKSESDLSEPGPSLATSGGCLLVDRRGNILYYHVCVDSNDWPDVDVLLEQVKTQREAALAAAAANKTTETENEKNNEKLNSTVVSLPGKNADDMNVAVTSKKKCCTIL